MHSKLCAFLRRLIGLSPPPQLPEISATMRGELIDLVDNEASRDLIAQARTQPETSALAPKPVQKPEPRPASTPPIERPRKPKVRYGGRANYVMRRGTRGK